MTTTALIKALGEHIGRPLQLRTSCMLCLQAQQNRPGCWLIIGTYACAHWLPACLLMP